MEIGQVRDLTAQAICQLLGDDYYSTVDETISTSDYIKALDSGKLIDVGKTVENFTNGTEQFTKSLIDQLSKIYIDSRAYIEELPDIFVDSNEFGGYIETVQFDLAKLIDDDMYNLVDGTSYDDHTFYATKVSVKLYGERKALTVPYSLATKQLRTAFKSWDSLNSFVSSLEVWVQNTVKVVYESYGKMLLSLACGYSISTDSGALGNCIHLLTEYNTIYNENLTPEQALLDKDCLLYIAKRIKEVRRLTSCMGTAFNDGSVNTFTPEVDKRLVLLGNYVDSLQMLAMSNTYHTDEILNGLGKYKEISTWQGHHILEPSTFSFSITTKAYTGDKIIINGLELVAGTDFSLSTDTKEGNAAAIVTALNSSSSTKVSGFTWSNDGAKITAVTDENHYAEKVTVKVMQAVSGTMVVSSVTTDVNGDTTNTLKDLSTIAIKTNDKLPFTTDFKQSYVIGLLYDFKALLISVNEQYSSSSYTGRCDFWNIYNHLLFNYCLNCGYNIISFVLD